MAAFQMLFDGMPVADAGAADQNKSSKNIKKIDIGVVSVDLPTYPVRDVIKLFFWRTSGFSRFSQKLTQQE